MPTGILRTWLTTVRPQCQFVLLAKQQNMNGFIHILLHRESLLRATAHSAKRVLPRQCCLSVCLSVCLARAGTITR